MSVTPAALSQAHRRKWRPQKLARGIIYQASVILLGFIMIYPILWLFASSLKAADEIWTNVASLIPHNITFENYINGWAGFGGVTFATFFWNFFF